MFYPWCFFFFFIFYHVISELPRPIALKLCHMITGVLYNASPKIRGALPLKKLGAKNMQNSARFQTTSDFDREYLRNGTRYPKSERNLITIDSSRIPPIKSSELWSTNYRELDVSLDPPNCFFRETISRPVGGAGPSNFNTHYRLTKAC